jgi:hypothetical protein
MLMAKIIVVMANGGVSEVLSTEPVEVGFIDYDTHDVDDADITRIPDGSGGFEDASVRIVQADIVPERTEELFALLA